jgi:Na+/proline symporter
MSSGVGWTLLISVGVVSLALGAWVYARYVRTSEDYLAAGRMLGAGLIGGSLIAAYTNSYTIFVNGSLAGGFNFPNYIVLLIVGLTLPVLLGPPIGVAVWRRFRQGYTQPEFLAARFGTSIHGYATVVQFANHLILFFSQIMIGGLVLTSLLHVPAGVIMVVVTLSIIIYTTVGGLWASVATDYLHILAALVAMVIILPLAIFYFGGAGAIYQGIMSHQPTYLTFTNTGAFWQVVISVALTIWAGVVQPQYVWQRYFSARSEGSIWRGMGSLALIYPGVAAIGAIPTYIAISQAAKFTGEGGPIAFLGIAPGWIVVPFTLIVLLMIMSCADSALMGLVSLFSVDVWAKYIKRRPVREVELTWVNRGSLVIFALIGLALAFAQVSIIQLFFIIGIMALTLIGPILFGLFSKRVTGYQPTVGAVAGLLVGCYLYFVSPWANNSFYADLACLAVPLIVSYLLSLTSPRRFSWERMVAEVPPVADLGTVGAPRT